jgi:heme/copper-type cytochrome/quinol oxidase subunit 2
MSPDDVAYGEDADQEDLWQSAAKELWPDKSLPRVAANAKFTVATVTVVGTGITALGVITVQAVIADRIARVLAFLSIGTALLAVLLALLYLALRVRKVNPENLVEVQSWYQKELRRTWLAVAASWLLIIAVVLASSAGLRTALTSNDQRPPQLALQIVGTGRERTVTASATLSNLRAGAVVVLRLDGEATGAKPVVLLMETKTTVSDTGTATISPSTITVTSYARYLLTLLVDNRERASLAIP